MYWLFVSFFFLNSTNQQIGNLKLYYLCKTLRITTASVWKYIRGCNVSFLMSSHGFRFFSRWAPLGSIWLAEANVDSFHSGSKIFVHKCRVKILDLYGRCGIVGEEFCCHCGNHSHRKWPVQSSFTNQVKQSYLSIFAKSWDFVTV